MSLPRDGSWPRAATTLVLSLGVTAAGFACSSAQGTTDAPAVAGESGTGVETATGGAAQGGKASFGGTSSAGDTGGALMSTGGKSAGVRTAPLGGGQATGGNPTKNSDLSSGGTLTTGGRAGTGGNSDGGPGGATGGGNAGTGGSKTMGGAKATGGAITAGGAKATGGTTGSISTQAGGAATGGNKSTSTEAPKKFVGNITTGYAAAADYNGMTYAHYWDQITPENAGKWGSVQGSASAAFNWTTLDSIYKYTETNKIIFKQHTFVWGAQQPTGTLTQANVETWIKTFCERYPNTKLIDVVNEPPPHTTPSYTSALGAGESGTYGWITKAFKLARQYCGSAVLILNDYNDLEYSDQENHIIDIVTQVVKAGGPIDAVGAQSHDVYKLSASQLQTALDTMHTKTGLPIYITEYDVSNTSDSGQLSTYQSQFPVMWKADYVHGITIWGWIYGQTWQQAANSGLVKDKAPRSAMTWLMQQLNRPVPPN